MSNNNNRGFAFDNHDDDNDNEDGEEPSKSSPQEQRMLEILSSKRQEVIASLLDSMGPKCRDFENTLNAQLVLLELTDSEQLFGKLIEKQNLTSLIGHACDVRNENQPYALHILATIIKEYQNQASSLSEELMADFSTVSRSHFFDIVYSTMLTIKSTDRQLGIADTDLSVNQAGLSFKRFGNKRMRALELLRQILQTFAKQLVSGEFNLLTPILRKQILSTLLETIETYEFSNVASQTSIQILDSLKASFDDSDISLLKSFVRKHLSSADKTHITFASGNTAHRGHLAAIIKMALELKKITSDIQSQGGSTDDETASRGSVEDPEWTKFCGKELKVHETKWTKKLELYGPEDHSNNEENPQDDEEEEDDEPEGFRMQPGRKDKKAGSRSQSRYDNSDQSKEEQEEEESNIGQMLDLGAAKKKTLLAHRSKVHIRPSAEELKRGQNGEENGDDDEEDEQSRFEHMLEKQNDIIEAKGEEVEPHKETVYLANVFWKAPDILTQSIDDLLAEEGYY